MADADAFSAHRPRLTRIAYRMLGSVAEAEDVVQDAWLRWNAADRTQVRDPAAFLVRTITRLCLDVLKSARSRRETYIGPWLPEPVVEPVEPDDGLSLALMMALERLSPLERAAFLLHDVFGARFEEVARALDRDPAACRQLAARARAHVRAAKPRFPVTAEDGQRISAVFFAAVQSGDVTGLRRLLAEDAVLLTDGGGKITAALNPILGADRIARFFAGVARKPGYVPPSLRFQGLVDGLPGHVAGWPDGTLQSVALEIEAGRIKAVYIVRNPDKLRHLHMNRHGTA